MWAIRPAHSKLKTNRLAQFQSQLVLCHHQTASLVLNAEYNVVHKCATNNADEEVAPQ